MLMFLLVACSGKDVDSGDDSAVGDDGPATLTELQADLFTPTCGPCHGAADGSGGLDLRDGSTFASLVGTASVGSPTNTRVIAGDADGSYIVMKLTGAAGIAGDQMPQGNPGIDDTRMARLRSWIEDGAQDN